MTEFEFERDEILTNLVLLEDHGDKFPCPYCMEKHSSKIIGYAEEIAMGGEDVDEMEKLAADARKWRRKIQGAKAHSHDDVAVNSEVHDVGLVKCETRFPDDERKLAKCIKKLEKP